MKRIATIVLALFVSFGALVVGPLGAQEDKGSVDRLVRDQRAIKSRLEKLASKMDRLQGKLRQENKPSADLLAAALKEIDSSDLKSRMDEVVPDLTAGRFSSVERQDQVMKDLEHVYSILLARKDLDQLEEQLAQVREALRSLGNLRTMQHDLTQKTAATSQAEQALVKKALEAAAELSKQQQELLAATEAAAKDANKDESNGGIEALKQQLDELATRQGALLKKTEKSVESVTGGAAKKLEEAEKAESSAVERAKPDSPTGESSPTGDPSTTPLTDAEKEGFLSDQRRAQDALDAIGADDDAGAEPSPDADAAKSPAAKLPAQAEKALAAAKEAIAKAREGADRKDRATAKSGAEEALAALKDARAALTEAARTDPRATPEGGAAEQQAIAAQAEELAKKLQDAAAKAGSKADGKSLQDKLNKALKAKSGEKPEAENGAAESTESKPNDGSELANAAEAQKSAGEHAKEAAEQLDSKDPAAAQTSEKKALDAMNAARSALDQKAAAEESAREQLGAKQNYLEARARELKEMLSRANPSSPDQSSQESGSQESGSEEARQHAENSRKAMEQAAQKLKSNETGSMGASEPDQRTALEQLDQLKEALEKQAAEQQAKAKAANADTPAEREKFKDLADRQKDLEEKTRDLMDRMKQMKDRKDSGSMEQAAGRMNDAKKKLDEEDGAEAVPKQEDAEKYLDKAQQELKKDEERYQNLRQEELLFRVKDALTKLREDLSGLLAKTGEIDLERVQKGGQLSRSARSRVKDLSNETRTLKGKNDEAATKVKSDGSQVFTFLFDRNSEDLDRIADLLGTRPNVTDDSTQSVQRDVIDRYDQMLAALTDEMDRRRKAAENAPEQPQNGPNQEQKQKLIPDVAELLMVKKLEENAMTKLDTFAKTLPEPSDDAEAGVDEITRDRLQRLGHQHARITELFTQLIQSKGGPPQSATDEPKEDGK